MLFSRHRRSSTKKSGRALRLECLESRTLLSSIPFGSIDLLSRTTVAGWTMNADDGAQPLEVDITLNGVKSVLTANAARPDLTAVLGSPYHAFTYSLPALNLGTTTLLIEAVSPTTGVRATLRSTTLTNPAPLGNVDALTASTVAGWAYDSDASGPIQIRVDVDGVAGTPTATSLARPDVATYFHISGYNNVGFNIPGSYDGHVIEVYALDNPTNTARLIYTNNHLPRGSVDVNNGTVVAGWAVDPDDTSASISVRVDVDGVTLAGTPATANLSRGDLVAAFGSANHGYSISIPGLTPGQHTITVYAIDGQAGSAVPVAIGSKVVTNAAPVGHVDVVNASVVAGWALDPDLAAAPTTVNVYIDDTLFSSVSASLARPDLIGPFGSANHGFVVDLSSLPVGSHSVTVTVMDNRTSDENEIVFYDDFINNHTPIGSVDLVSTGMIYGWAYDQDAGAEPIEVDVYVDGVYAATTSANLARPDIDAYLHSANHAYATALPTMSFGTHKIDVYAAESQGNVSVLIGTKIVTNSRPLGNADAFTSTVVAGWAFDPDNVGQSASIKVFVNGVLATTATANLSRPDLLALPALSGTSYNNYGFSINLSLSSGTNQVDVYTVDKNNGLLTPLASKSLLILPG